MVDVDPCVVVAALQVIGVGVDLPDVALLARLCKTGVGWW